MPIEISYDFKHAGVILTHYGVTTGKEQGAIGEEICKSQAYPSFKYMLIDRSNSDRYIVEADDLMLAAELTRRYKPRNPNLLLALVNPDDDNFGSAHIYQLMTKADGYKSIVTRTKELALEWVVRELSRKPSPVSSDDYRAVGYR